MCSREMSYLEIGCGTGLILLFLHKMGVTEFLGIDQDAALEAVMPGEVGDRFNATDVWGFLENEPSERRFDRILMFDVLEHFDAAEGVKLLSKLKDRLNTGGRVITKTPNAAFPWGLQFQYGDLTHRTPYTPESMRQVSVASGLTVRACYPHYLGSPSRCVRDKAFHRILGFFLATPLEIWTANFFSILERPE